MKNKNCFFSIIIPVYNVEKYLNQCIDSVLFQDFKNYEIILVNDGSSDSSPLICKYYANKYDHIKVIHKENGGLSDARNTGTKVANGEYILFLDSDDYWLDTPILFPLLNYALKHNNPDVILYGSSWIDSNDQAKLIQYQERSGLLDVDIKHLVKKGIFDTIAWNKCIKRSLVNENKLIFPLGKYHEDCAWCFDVAYTAKTYAIFPLSFYQYRVQRTGAITASINDRHIDDLFYILNSKLKIWETLTLDRKDQLGYYIFNIYISVFYKNEMLSDSIHYEDRLNKLENIKSILLPYSGVGKYSLIKRVMYNILGIKNSIRLIKNLRGFIYEK